MRIKLRFHCLESGGERSLIPAAVVTELIEIIRRNCAADSTDEGTREDFLASNQVVGGICCLIIPLLSLFPFIVGPLEVKILNPMTPLVADRRYEVTCESRGTRPNAIITWYKGKRQLKRAKVSNVRMTVARA
jgi:CD80-like C2-set immunoglobulin domain